MSPLPPIRFFHLLVMATCLLALALPVRSQDIPAPPKPDRITVKGVSLEGKIVGLEPEGIRFETIYGKGIITINDADIDTISTENKLHLFDLLRHQRGWRDDLPLVLVLGGGFGLGPVAEVLAAIDQLERPVQTVLVAGRNEALRTELAAQERRHPTDMLGFVTNMHELMSVADIIVSKPGGLTTSEALALGKPLFILNPIPGQEAANSDYLLERGAAVKVNRVEDVTSQLRELLGSAKLKKMSRAAARLGRPESARAVCEAIQRQRQNSLANPLG